jgi:hypothetical protein
MAIGDRKSMSLLYDIFTVVGVLFVVGVAYKIYEDYRAASVKASESSDVVAPEATLTVGVNGKEGVLV